MQTCRLRSITQVAQWSCDIDVSIKRLSCAVYSLPELPQMTKLAPGSSRRSGPS